MKRLQKLRMEENHHQSQFRASNTGSDILKYFLILEKKWRIVQESFIYKKSKSPFENFSYLIYVLLQRGKRIFLQNLRWFLSSLRVACLRFSVLEEADFNLPLINFSIILTSGLFSILLSILNSFLSIYDSSTHIIMGMNTQVSFPIFSE